MKRVRDYFKSLFIEDHLEDAQQVLLWRGVLDQSLVDYLTEETKTSVSIWIEEEFDFETVCEYAKLEPEIVKGVFYELFNRKKRT